MAFFLSLLGRINILADLLADKVTMRGTIIIPLKKTAIFTRSMYQYIDKEFNKDFTKHYSLLFQLDEQQYSYAIYEKRSGNLHVLKSVQLNSASSGDMLNKLRISVTSEDLLQVPFSEVKIGITNTAFTLIPRVIFEEEMTKNYLELSAEVKKEDHILVNNINKIFIKNVFSIPDQEFKYVNDIFSSPKLFHIGTALLETVVRNKDNFFKQQLIIDIKPGILHILFFENKEFKFMNQFRFVNKDDFLYYVLLVADQYAVDRNSCDLKLSGEIMPDSLLFGELWKFFKTISFLPTNENIILPKDMQEKPLYIHNSLLSLDLCE